MASQVITITDDEEEFAASRGRESNDKTANESTPHRPPLKTPPSSQRVDRGGKGVQHGKHRYATPSSSSSRAKRAGSDDDFIDDEDDDDDNLTPSKKRAKKSIPSKGSMWELWEDQILLKAIFAHGDRGCKWQEIARTINASRGSDEARTEKSVSCHWALLKKSLPE